MSLAFSSSLLAASVQERTAIDTGRSFTVCAWVNLGSLEGNQTVVRRSGKSAVAFSLQKRAGDDRFAFTVSETDSLQSAVRTAVSDFTPTPGLWYHLAGVYDANAHQIRLYADGTLLASARAVLWKSAGPTEIGGDSANGGTIDRVRFFPRSLSGTQIAALYQSERASFQPGIFTWANPIYFQGNSPGADIHDPDIIKDAGVYYLVATLAPFRNYTDRDPKLPDLGSAPGISIYASRDLKVWKFQNWLLKSSDLPVNCPYKHQFWAPEIHKFNHRYYVIFGGSNWIADKYNIGGQMGYYQFIGVADKVTGPYSHFTALKGPGVDTSLFQDDDGKTYAVWPRNEIHPIDLSKIDQGIVTVGPKISQAATDADFQAIGKPAPNTLEGPYLIKHEGTYYCFFAETYPDLYATGVASAKSLSGPWTLDPRWRVFPGGHQALFTGSDGRFWTAYKHEKSNDTPWLSIDPVDFDAQGRVQITPTDGPQSIPLPPGSNSLR